LAEPEEQSAPSAAGLHKPSRHQGIERIARPPAAQADVLGELGQIQFHDLLLLVLADALADASQIVAMQQDIVGEVQCARGNLRFADPSDQFPERVEHRPVGVLRPPVVGRRRDRLVEARLLEAPLKVGPDVSERRHRAPPYRARTFRGSSSQRLLIAWSIAVVMIPSVKRT
jgi:hypothetical protein